MHNETYVYIATQLELISNGVEEKKERKCVREEKREGTSLSALCVRRGPGECRTSILSRTGYVHENVCIRCKRLFSTSLNRFKVSFRGSWFGALQVRIAGDGEMGTSSHFRQRALFESNTRFSKSQRGKKTNMKQVQMKCGWKGQRLRMGGKLTCRCGVIGQTAF